MTIRIVLIGISCDIRRAMTEEIMLETNYKKTSYIIRKRQRVQPQALQAEKQQAILAVSARAAYKASARMGIIHERMS